MKIFLDTADIEEIRTAARWGILDGVTTNPTLYSKVQGASYEDILREVCSITPGPVSAEVVADDVNGMLDEGRAYAKLAPNIVVKVAMSENGLEAISRFAEEGIKTNCTLVFSTNQGFLAAKAGASLLSPFVGRLDDWMKVLAERDGIAVNPNALDWSGIATFKRAYGIFAKREFRARLLSAAYRHRLHWTELVGGDIVMTLTHAWQVRFNESGIVPRPRIDEPVDPAIVDELLERIPDFRRAYEPDGLTIDEFDGYGATVRTLRQFIRSYHDLVGAVRDIVLPDPDVKPA